MNRRTMLAGLGASLIPTVGAVSGTPLPAGDSSSVSEYEYPEITFYGEESNDGMVRVYLTLELNGFDTYRATFYTPPLSPWQERPCGEFTTDVTMEYIGEFDPDAKFMGTFIADDGNHVESAPLNTIQMVSNDECRDPTPVEPHEYQETPQDSDGVDSCDGGGSGSGTTPIEPHR